MSKRERGFAKLSGTVSVAMKYFLCVLGMVMIVEGLPYFAAPVKMRVWIKKMAELPDSTLRVAGFLLMIVGLGLVYMGRS
jgi:uncharacterized protein YjeT (DUF2065 family)